MKNLLETCLYAIVVVILGMGVGNGINAVRADLSGRSPGPLQPPTKEADPQRQPQPAVQENRLTTTTTPDEAMFLAIVLWEHRGVVRSNEVSRAGAVGPAQITPIFLADMNEYLGTAYTLRDSRQWMVAYRLTKAFWRKYQLTTDEQRARCHLAGPRAMTRKQVWPETTEYWAGVQQYLNLRKECAR